MILELIMIPFWAFIHFIISLLPQTQTIQYGFESVLDLVGYGCAIVGSQFFLMVISNIVFWLTLHLSWSIIEWLYKKVPGVS
jgi:hypothetical protein